MAYWMIAMAALQGIQAIGASNAQDAEGNYQNEMAQINARNAQLQAQRAIKTGESSALTRKKQINQIVGQQRTGFAGGGVDVNYGSARDIQKETMEAGAEEVANIRNNAFLQAMGYETESENISRSGRMAATSGRTRSAQTLLAGGIDTAKDIRSELRRSKDKDEK